MLKYALIALIALPLNVRAETYTVNGAKSKTRIEALSAAFKDHNAKIERCAYKEVQNKNEGKVICRPVELSPKGTLVLAK